MMSWMSLLVFLSLLQDADAAGRCGSEVRWETSPKAALERAAKEKKPVCWYVHTVAGTKMDRKRIVDNYMKMGPFMSEDVVDLLNRRFIPLRAEGRGEEAKAHAIRRMDFIEPGLVFLSPEGKLLHKMDRLYTFNEDWFLDQMFLVLGENEFERRLSTERDTLERARLLRRLRRPEEAADELKKAPESPAVRLERGLLAVKRHRWDEAEEALHGLEDPHALFLLGCLLHLTLRETEAVELWRRAAATEGHWAWKAAAELRREGPFSRMFEEIGWLPPDAYGSLLTTSDRPRTLRELDAIVRRGVDFLLRHQKSSGVWNDSNYDFAGTDSLPDVYVAVTALAAWALHSWRETAPDRIGAAVARADRYLLDENHLATTNDQERAWAHLYRIHFWSQLGGRTEEIGKAWSRLRDLQQKDGLWYHEYPNPFVTASVLHAMKAAKEAGVDVDDAPLRRAARAIASCRSRNGLFSYGVPPEPTPIESTAGRMPLCSSALLPFGKAKLDDVRTSISKAFEYHPLREKVRKYDDHADRWGNGGFFFYYDLLGISLAAEALPERERSDIHRRLREIVLSIGEIDGSWQDSHELGKAYGTAAALILLHRAARALQR